MRAAALYVAFILLANLTATFFLPVAVGPVSLPLAVGTLVFGLVFTQRDRLHHRGRGFVYRTIFAAAAVNLAVMVIFAQWGARPLAEALPAGWTWLRDGLLLQADAGWRVFLASFLAIVLAEACDTEVFERLKRRGWWTRVLTSNAVSIPLDSAVFNLVAFAGVLAPVEVALIILADLIFKTLVGALWALRGAPRAAAPGLAAE